MPKLLRGAPYFPVGDVAASAGFYERVLGFKCEYMAGSPAEFAILSRDGHGIMLRALESGTAGLHVPTGEVRDFPANTSDALTSGGTYAIAGAIERMYRNIVERCGTEPVCIMTGGAGWKMAPYLTVPFQLVESLIFDGLLRVAEQRTIDRVRR